MYVRFTSCVYKESSNENVTCQNRCNETISESSIGIFFLSFSSFAPNGPFLYSLKTSENLTVLCFFRRKEKRCIGNKWANRLFSDRENDYLLNIVWRLILKLLGRLHIWAQTYKYLKKSYDQLQLCFYDWVFTFTIFIC